MFSLVGIVLIPDFRPPDVIAEFHPHHEPDQISENRRFVEPSGNQFLSKLCMRDGSPRPAKLLHDPRLRRRAPQTGIAHQLTNFGNFVGLVGWPHDNLPSHLRSEATSTRQSNFDKVLVVCLKNQLISMSGSLAIPKKQVFRQRPV